MRKTDRLSTPATLAWAGRCLCLLSVWAGWGIARAADGPAFPSASQPDISQFDFLDDPYSTHLTGVKWTAAVHRDYPASQSDSGPAATIRSATGELAPGPAEVFAQKNVTQPNQRPAPPAILPSGFDDLAVRGGWWYVHLHGSETKVGQYQDLAPSPFWNVDLLKSNGESTLDLQVSGLDNETSQTSLYLFTPSYEANLRYERFIHRLVHDPLLNMPRPGSGAEIIAEDVDAGDDYAVRIQDIRTDVSGQLAENVKYDLDVWFRRKKGERQALGTHHGMAFAGFPCRVCHILSQTQEIDWVSTRIEPAIEGRFGLLTARYSRPMRFFGQNDSVVTRSYGSFHPYNNYTTDSPYAVVPDTVAQTDRLKLRADLPSETIIYSQLYRGSTDNLHRDTQRGYYGFDIRLTNAYFRRLTLSSFARYNRQLNEFPPYLVPPEDPAVFAPTAIVPPYNLRHPIDYLRTAAGADAVWHPLRSGKWADQLSLNAGVEIGAIGRSYADYQIENPPGFASQDHTSYTTYSAGTSMRWHPRVDNRLWFKHRNTAYPLYGLSSYFDVTNTNRPTSEDIVGFDTTWLAADNLMATASVSFENRSHHSSVAEFVEDNYPMTFTFWYAPRPSWSLSGGYGFLSNWIDQDVYLPGNSPEIEPLVRQQWNYGGRGQTMSLGGSYAWTKQVTLSGSVQQVWGSDATDPTEPWPDLPSYFDVQINTRRYMCGLDWSAHSNISAYLRYVYEDFDDVTSPYNTGRAQMILAGLTGTR